MRLTDEQSGRAAVWQLVECCGYDADLAAWSSLAGDPGGSVLDLGCGIGRVTRPLAALGHAVMGVDSDPDLVAELNRMATEPRVAAVVGDVLALDSVDLGRPTFDRVFAPQQLVQIIGDRATGRDRLLAGVRRRVAPDGLAAFAISARMPEVSTAAEVIPDVREIGGWVFSSRPVEIVAEPGSVTVVRLREVVAPDGSMEESEDRITLRRVDERMLGDELAAAGFTVDDVIEIPQTEMHVGSSLLVARPA